MHAATAAVPDAAARTGTRTTRVIGVLALATTAFVVVSAFFLTPADSVQGDSVRIMYAHVPTAWVAYLAFITTAVASGFSLARRHRTLGFDRVAGASGEHCSPEVCGVASPGARSGSGIHD